MSTVLTEHDDERASNRYVYVHTFTYVVFSLRARSYVSNFAPPLESACISIVLPASRYNFFESYRRSEIKLLYKRN